MALFIDNVEGLGIDHHPKLLDGPVIYSKCISSPDKFPLCVQRRMGAGLPRRVHVRAAALRRQQPVPGVLQLLAPRRERRTSSREWGYPAGTTVPDVDDRMTECAAIARSATSAYQCWADFDKYMMEEVVPWVPKTFTNTNDITSARVVNYSFDYCGQQAAFGNFAFANGGA